MHIRLPNSRRHVIAALAGIVLGAFFAVTAPRVAATWDRPACAEKIMQAVSSDRTVVGAYTCFAPSLQSGLNTIGVNSDSAFAIRIGQKGEYHFVNKTADGGYVYEFDRPTRPHDKFKGAVVALGMPSTSVDVRRGDLVAAWHERHDLGTAWAEITGQTQLDHSQLFTFYMDGDGKVASVK